MPPWIFNIGKSLSLWEAFLLITVKMAGLYYLQRPAFSFNTQHFAVCAIIVQTAK